MANQDLSPLFSKQDETMAESFRDKVRILFEHFDKDGDGFLNLKELAALQKATEGVILTEEMYLMACRTLNCQPGNGITLGALKVTYASDGADVGGYIRATLLSSSSFKVGANWQFFVDCITEKDYLKVFPENKPKEENDEDKIYEAGEDGFDISS